MNTRRTYKVSDVSRMSGVSVRALHHYDEIGLLRPSARSSSDYRLYDDDDLLRLQQILVGRELGMSLEAIKRSLDDPQFDRRAALRQQRLELAARAERTAAMLRAVDDALALLDDEGASTMTESHDSVKSIFSGFDPAKYEAEAEQRWGQTDAWRESSKRASKYSDADWSRYKAESDAIMNDAAKLLREGVAPESVDAMDVAERHRRSIDQWFYPCAKGMHASLADMYEADERFAANIDVYGEGLTRWFSAAIRANARR